ncbi:YebC/PmpR family DNA-binding transcriptional regulator [Mycoplasmopsis arginini]|uniref:YebC/PmpR family DNA-binding transcriptional regulator n=1 Tax=Mycoplasmopsis arginini TaxID=2094 RepID=UPI0005C276D3|nr:YebC/PmpR family DNA-binding transcriptional regulator [Mycoplasmopsis arginini]MCY2903157.1 YebC/PmpR family DNA-binding transcriptional regulator [Mycoplasmopsis arginini QMP CG1-2758]MDI3348393.1 YebC/PmpR family DNA-binding transcriptional regulator [Mycoplasmopsis arginini]MDI3349086.1 YebC/PmpR family DNA-binding transcriptional regulator [Mycoplasmopsis arginini]MDI3350204.1 YebC/PmpR family DNA-binding transcriptional regulator [Mycoplasmopsis arginini]MDI3350734.1 YebC/PmpR family 
MSGHSKWATTKHHKAAMDSKRAQMFQKFSKEIIVAATIGGPDPDSNPALKLAIAKAKAKSMPKANIEKAISKVSGGSKEGANFQSYLYSGTAFGGINFVVSCLTDNFNRLASNIKHYFNKYNGQLGKQGTVPYVFDQKGLIEFSKELASEEEVMMTVLDAGAEDFQVEEDLYVITTQPSDFQKVKQALDETFKIENYSTAEVTYISNSDVEVDEEKMEQLEKFVDLLEDDEDIQEVWHNADLV